MNILESLRKLINKFPDKFDTFLDFLLIGANESLQVLLKFFTERKFFVTAEFGVSYKIR